MGNTWLRGVLLAVPFTALGCGSSDGGSNTNNVGGSTSSSGGAATGGVSNNNTGGTKAATGGSTGNSTAATGGKAATGGGQATGGSTPTNTGNPSTGGVANTGGTKAVGGASTGTGTRATGGATTNGGAAATGGATTNGGAAATGGATTNGGAAATGGATTNGGSGAGGAATGGASSTTPSEPVCVTSTNNNWTTATLTTATSGTADVTVNDTATGGQTWEGFGGAFNELGWTYLTSQTMKDKAIQLLFGTDGAHFTWGRIPMGASDYATSRYTLDDPAGANPTPPAARPTGDSTLAGFTITNGHDDINLIPFIKAAQAVNDKIHFWASPWTPPIWMKTGYNSTQAGSMSGWKASYFDGGSMNGTSNLAAYAEYYKKFVTAYKDKGINIEIVSPQNEPGYEQNYPSCLWDSATYVSWVKTLGAAMQPLNVKVMLGTMSNNGDTVAGVARKDIDIAKAVLNDSTARGYIANVGVQWGVLGQVVTDNGSTFGNGLKVWATEHKCGNYPWETSTYNKTQAPNDQAYGVESWGYIRDAINKAKVTSYNAWNMVLDKNGLGIDTSRDWRQDALLVANSGQVNTTQAYYVFRHFSQFVDAGDTVVTTSGGDAVAFKKPDGTIVAVMYNSGGAKSNYTAKIGSRYVQFSMPSAGWATVVLPPA